MPFPIEHFTERLHLRPITLADAERVFDRYCHDPRVTRYMSWKPHRTVEETRDYLRQRIDDNEAGRTAGYLIFLRDGDRLLGSVGGKIDGATVQFGYCLARDAWGHGFATEAARTFVAAAWTQPEIWRVQAFCDVENRTSARVLEKIALKHEGTLRRYMMLPNLGETPRDVHCYAAVRDDVTTA